MVRCKAVDLHTAIGHIKNAMPTVAANSDGVHFKFASRNGVMLIEQKRRGRFYYWLIALGLCEIVASSESSKLRPLHSVGDTLSLNP